MDPKEFMTLWIGSLRARMRVTATRPREVAQLLHVGESSLRKRFRGEVPFSAEEFLLLSDRFDLPRSARELAGPRLDLHTSGSAADAFDEGAYLRELHRFTAGIVADNDGREAGIALTICAADIPVHQLLADPVLMVLKLYFFDTNSRDTVARRFDLAAALERHRDLTALAGEVHEYYSRTDSVEVWGRDPIGSFLYQIAKHARAHAISDADLRVVFERLRALVARVGRDASASRKAGGGRFELHQNWLATNNALFLVATPAKRYSFLTIANPHYLYSTRDETHAFFARNAEVFLEQSVKVSGAEAVNGGRFGEALARRLTGAETAIATFREAEAMF